MALCTSTFLAKDKSCLFADVFFRGVPCRDCSGLRLMSFYGVFFVVSCFFTLRVICALMCAVSGALCPAVKQVKVQAMTQETKRYFERYFKMPFVKTLPKAGPLGLPALPKCTEIPKGLVCFDEIKPETSRKMFLHCHTTDEKIERLWLDPDRYIAKFAEFRGMYPPDFSQFTDMDPAASIWNLYRLRVLASIFATEMQVMPVATWSTPESYPYTFDGLPRKSIIGVSTVGVLRRREHRELFMAGYSEMVKRLDPELVILYGGMPKFELPGPETVWFPNSHYAWANEEQMTLWDEEGEYGV